MFKSTLNSYEYQIFVELRKHAFDPKANVKLKRFVSPIWLYKESLIDVQLWVTYGTKDDSCVMEEKVGSWLKVPPARILT